MTQDAVLKLFGKYGALLSGHFKLSSGLHSGKYLQCALILQHPDAAGKLAAALARKFSKERIDVVIGPALGGITLAYELARSLGVRGIFAEREDGAMTLRRGFSVKKGERALVAEDVVTTGGSTKEVIDIVKRSGGIVSGVAAIVDRSSGEMDFGAPFRYLARMQIETFKEDSCPLCRSGSSAVKPGSRK
jgi:orotate phosphoribosyltransferase